MTITLGLFLPSPMSLHSLPSQSYTSLSVSRKFHLVAHRDEEVKSCAVLVFPVTLLKNNSGFNYNVLQEKVLV